MDKYIGAYRVERELGEGGFGVVYQAYQPFLDRKVAIKTLHTDLTANPQIEQQFMHEARTIARLRHPGIVSVYEFGTLPTQPKPMTYMVMEHLPGETLDQRMKRERLSVPEIVSTIDSLGQALDYAHKNSVIHRDLKPTNIMFSDSGEAVIVDFGLAKLIEIGTGVSELTNTAESTVSGTPAYMSPEQLIGERAKAASDQYALALIAYQLLTGHFPHDTSNAMTLMMDRLNKPPKRASDYLDTLPVAVDAVFAKAFSKDPLERYPSAGEFAHAFGDALLPNRQQSRVVTVIDPLQAALIEATRSMMRGFLLTLAAVVFVIMAFCMSLFWRGFQVGLPTFFVWDGIIAEQVGVTDVQRSVIGIWPDSPAAQAGVRIGDVISGDILLDGNKALGDYSVNGVPRTSMALEWTRKIGDEITRTVERNGQAINVAYRLESSTYFIFQLFVYVVPAITGFICALILLRRWGAEPGLQIFFPLLLTASFFMITRVMGGRIMGGRMIPYLDTVVVHILMPALVHFMLIFPAPLDWVKKHSRWLWLLYAPLVIALIEFMTGQGIPPNSSWEITLFHYIFWALCILILLIFKWIRRDVKVYRGMWWYIAGFAIIPFVSIADSLMINTDSDTVIRLFGNTSILYMIMPVQLAAVVTLVMILASIGYHRVQSLMGETLSVARVSSSTQMLVSTPAFGTGLISEQTPLDKTFVLRESDPVP